MSSTRKQKAKEERSRHSDMISDVKNLDMMLGHFSGNSPLEGRNNGRSEIETASAGLKENTNTFAEFVTKLQQ